MTSQSATLGRAIAEKRKQLNLSQKELATKIVKEDGQPITPQYLNDIEHDRRSPSSDHIVKQFAEKLSLDIDYLYYLAGTLPADIRDRKLSPNQVSRVMTAFRKSPRAK